MAAQLKEAETMDPTKEMIDVTIRIPWSLWARIRLEGDRAGLDAGAWIANEIARADRLAREMNRAYAAADREEARMRDLAGRTQEVFANWKDFLADMS